jgi:hypothetical protein
MVNVCFASTCHHITSTTHGGEAVLLAEAKTTRALRVRAEDALDRAADGQGGIGYSWSTQKQRRSATPGEEVFNPLACDLWGSHARRTVTRVKYLRVWFAGSSIWVKPPLRLPQVAGGPRCMDTTGPLMTGENDEDIPNARASSRIEGLWMAPAATSPRLIETTRGQR